MLKPVSALAALFIIGTTPAQAEILSQSSLGMVRYDPSGTSADPIPGNGVLTSNLAFTLYANVDFNYNGYNVCSLSVIYGDTNGSEQVSATLYRKPIVIGGNVEAAPQAMVTAKSPAGAVVGMRKSTNATVNNKLINKAANFYYLVLTNPNFNTIPVGVQIDYRPTCP